MGNPGVIRSKSEGPVYLWIDNGVVEVRNAEYLWGEDSWETTDILKKELGDDISVLAIGQAGENLVRFACPVIDYHHAPGRSHAGCVMGAKKLKAIAIRGTKEIPVVDTKKFKEAVREVLERISSHPDGEERIRLGVGSNYQVKTAAERGTANSRNFSSWIIPPDSDIWGLPQTARKYMTVKPEVYGYHCPMAQYYGCDLVADIKSGKYAGLKLGGISYSLPSWEWGGNCGIKSYPAMWKCRELCQRYGMDQAGPIPFAMELFEKGIITKEDTDGLELEWGNEIAVQQMLRKIAYRGGLGDVLAEGSARAAKRIGKGAEKYVMTIKDKEIQTGWDPRTYPTAGGLGILACPRGGDDLKTTHALREGFPSWAANLGWSDDKYLRWLLDRLDMFEVVKRRIYGVPPRLEGYTLEGKAAAITKWYGELTSVFDSLGLCLFSGNTYLALGPTHYAKLYSACTGWQITPSELMKTGERIFNLMKAYTVREGLTRKDDDWPDRFYEEPILLYMITLLCMSGAG